MPYRQTERVKLRLAATRVQLLKTARQIVMESGFAGLTIARLATRAGVATGTVYRYFPSKDDLCLEVFRRACDREAELAWQEARGSGPADQRLAAAIRVVATRAMEGATAAYPIVAEPAGDSLERERRVYRENWSNAFAHAIRAGITDGVFPKQDADISAACITGAILEALIAPLSQVDTARHTPRTVDGIVRFAMAGVRYPSDSEAAA